MREEAGLAKEKGLKREVSPRSRNFFSASPSFLFLCSPSFFSQSFLPQAPQVLSSCTESSRKSHPAFLLFQSFANLFLPLSFSPFLFLPSFFLPFSRTLNVHFRSSSYFYLDPLSSSAVCIAPVAVAVAVAAGGGCAFPELRNSNEISGKVNILCVNQILANIREREREREDRWQGASKLNKSVTREYNLVLRLSSLFMYIYMYFVPFHFALFHDIFTVSLNILQRYLQVRIVGIRKCFGRRILVTRQHMITVVIYLFFDR